LKAFILAVGTRTIVVGVAVDIHQRLGRIILIFCIDNGMSFLCVTYSIAVALIIISVTDRTYCEIILFIVDIRVTRVPAIDFFNFTRTISFAFSAYWNCCNKIVATLLNRIHLTPNTMCEST
jgi:hypothetical protein